MLCDNNEPPSCVPCGGLEGVGCCNSTGNSNWQAFDHGAAFHCNSTHLECQKSTWTCAPLSCGDADQSPCSFDPLTGEPARWCQSGLFLHLGTNKCAKTPEVPGTSTYRFHGVLHPIWWSDSTAEFVKHTCAPGFTSVAPSVDPDPCVHYFDGTCGSLNPEVEKNPSLVGAVKCYTIGTGLEETVFCDTACVLSA
jgi:hypothetical protein